MGRLFLFLCGYTALIEKINKGAHRGGSQFQLSFIYVLESIVVGVVIIEVALPIYIQSKKRNAIVF